MGTADQTGRDEGPPCGSGDLRADARRNIRSILEAAARVLAEDPAASVQEIADAAEVSRPTVYRHFSNREELIDAIRLEAMTQARESLDAAAASSEPAADALERLILDLADIVARYPAAGLVDRDASRDRRITDRRRASSRPSTPWSPAAAATAPSVPTCAARSSARRRWGRWSCPSRSAASAAPTRTRSAAEVAAMVLGGVRSPKSDQA